MTCTPVSAEKLFQELSVWRDPLRQEGGWHMAADESLLHAMDGRPILRLYQWARAEVSAGYTQSSEMVRAFAGSRPWVRRWTAGGLVEHGTDLTLTLAIPSKDPAAQLRATALYERIHQAVLESLRESHASAKRASPEEFASGAACFNSPVCGDLMMQGRKILGGAMRRSRAGTLYQGSLQVPGVPDEFPSSVAASLSHAFENWTPDGSFLRSVERLRDEKYESRNWAELR